MKVNKASILDGNNDLKNTDSNVVSGASISKKTNTRKTFTNKSLVFITQQTNVTLIPSHFNHILHTFVQLDMVVNKLIKQRIPLYFDQITEGLKEMNIRNFDLNVFGQILRIFPESYFYEFNKLPLKITRHYKEKLKLIPNLEYGTHIDCLPKKPEKCLRSDQLEMRKSIFYDRLLEIVRKKHNDFLMMRNNNKSISNLDGEDLSKDLSKWHEEFNLEAELEVIEPLVLDRNITDAKMLLLLLLGRKKKGRTSGRGGEEEREKEKSVEKSSPLKEISNIMNSLPQFSRLSITNRQEHEELLSQPALALTSRSAVGRVEEKKKSIVAFKFSQKSNDKENKIPLRSKSVLLHPLPSSSSSPLQQAAPIRSDAARKSLIVKKSRDSISHLHCSSRLSSQLSSPFTLGITPPKCGNNNNNFLANLALPDSPLLKDEFFLKQKLPAHLKILAEMFISLEKMIYKVHRQNRTVSLSMICSGNAITSKYKFTELQLGRIVSIYPAAYSLKWQKLVNPSSIRPTSTSASTTSTTSTTSKFDVTISPNLAESKDFLKFDFEFMKMRRQKFFENCFEIVVSSYREFLVKNDVAVLTNIEEHIKTENWNKNFNIDLHVKQVEPTPMPHPPKKTTQGRVSFHVIKKGIISESTDRRNGQKLFAPMKENDKLKSLPKSLMDKVLQNKAKSVMSYQPRPGVKLCLLPQLVEIIATEFDRSKRVPICQSHVANMVCKSLDISEGSFNDYLNKIIELVPEWLEKLRWTDPTLSLSKSSNMSLEDVQSRLKNIIGEQA